MLMPNKRLKPTAARPDLVGARVNRNAGIYERIPMKTELRRKERAMKTSREMELLLERMPVGRLAVTTEEGPYIVAVNYLFFDEAFTFIVAWRGVKWRRCGPIPESALW
jgi:Pyridoxamine 5'-phosphate oxidase